MVGLVNYTVSLFLTIAHA